MSFRVSSVADLIEFGSAGRLEGCVTVLRER
jgi:hypothetical protein